MQVSKEYKNRWVKPLVNKGFTIDEYNRSKNIELAFEEFVNAIPSMSDNNGSDCTCETLLNGHANECPRNRNS